MACPHCGSGDVVVELSFGSSGGASQEVKMRCSGCRRPISAEALGLGRSSAAQAPAPPAPSPPRPPGGEPRCPSCGSTRISVQRTTARGNQRIQCQACRKLGTVRGPDWTPPAQVAAAPPAPTATDPPPTLPPSTPSYAASDWSLLLLDAADPQLYRRNAFRLTGLHTAAPSREVAQHGRRLEMAAKLGVASAGGAGPLAIEPAPDAAALHDALRRLHDPEHRFVEELFWFWADAGDEGLEALRRGDLDGARRCWQGRPGDALAGHDLAVLEHAVALDLEATPAQDAEVRQRRAAAWGEALTGWAALCGSEPAWVRLASRARELDDPRLDAGALARIRATLPVALLLISARLAVAAAEAGRRREAEAHRQWIEGAGFEPRAVPEALRRALEPVADRVRALCQAAEPEADAQPERGDQVTRRLLEQTRPLLSVIDAVLPAAHATRIAIHDEVALRALACQIPYGNKTKDWSGSAALLDEAIEVAASSSARTRISENRAIVRANQQFGTCWFCTTTAAEDAAGCEVKMHGEVRRTPVYNGVQLQWRTLTVPVPRCPRCRDVHTREEATWAAAIGLGLVIGIGSCVAQEGSGAGVAGAFLSFILGGGIGAAVTAKLRGEIKEASAANEYPSVKEKLGQGWAMGERPAE